MEPINALAHKSAAEHCRAICHHPREIITYDSRWKVMNELIGGGLEEFRHKNSADNNFFMISASVDRL